MAKKVLFGASVLFVLAAVAVFVAPMDSWAGIKPCCIGGSNPGKFCTTDVDCPDACVGGKNDGHNCATGCIPACVGGRHDGDGCINGDSDCAGTCALNNTACFVDADCFDPTPPPGTDNGPCSGPGACTNIGACTDDGSCTGLCLSKGKGPKASPTDPVEVSDDASEDVTVSSDQGSVPDTKPCP